MEQQLPPELDAHVAGTVRALQDDMQRVLERLSELELLTSRQVRGTAPTGGQLGVGRGRSGGRPRVVPRPGRAEAALEAAPGPSGERCPRDSHRLGSRSRRRTGTRWPDGVPGCAPTPPLSCRTHPGPIPESRSLRR